MSNKKLILIFLVVLYFVPGFSVPASLVLVPNIDQPQDAIDAAIQLPGAGVAVAMKGFNPQAGTGFFIFVKDGSIVSQEYTEDVTPGSELSILDGCEVFVTKIFDNAVELYVSCPRPYAVVLANSIDRNNSAPFIESLKGKGVEVDLVSAQGFNSFKDAGTIIILGGPDAPEGIGGFSEEILTLEEEDFLRTKDAKSMFIHKNPWKFNAGDVVVLAGNNRILTAEAAIENIGRFKV